MKTPLYQIPLTPPPVSIIAGGYFSESCVCSRVPLSTRFIKDCCFCPISSFSHGTESWVKTETHLRSGGTLRLRMFSGKVNYRHRSLGTYIRFPEAPNTTTGNDDTPRQAYRNQFPSLVLSSLVRYHTERYVTLPPWNRYGRRFRAPRPPPTF